MSYLLDALRKLEKEKEQHKPMALGQSPAEVATRDRRKSVGLWLLIGVNVLVLSGVLIWMFFPVPDAPKASEVVVETPAVPAVPSQQAVVTPPSVAVPATVPAAPAAQAPVASAPPAPIPVTTPESGTSPPLPPQPSAATVAVPVPPAVVPTVQPPVLAEAPAVAVPPPAPVPEAPASPSLSRTPSAVNTKAAVAAPKPVEKEASSRPDYTAARVFLGTLDGVKSGCHVELREGGALHQAVLEGIRCPAKGDAFWKEARSFTTRAAFGREVRVAVWGANVNGELLCDLHTQDGMFLNAALVKAGLAWSTGNALKRFEEEARQAKLGLWNLPGNE